jgi:hypothetical protein
MPRIKPVDNDNHMRQITHTFLNYFYSDVRKVSLLSRQYCKEISRLKAVPGTSDAVTILYSQLQGKQLLKHRRD